MFRDENGVTVLPDGSAFAVGSLPLPEDHWIYEADAEGFTGPPPMPMRMGIGPARLEMAAKIRAAAQWAVRASTMRGQDIDFDPDALVQNVILGLLGYWTPDGLGGEPWEDPDPIPSLFPGMG